MAHYAFLHPSPTHSPIIKLVAYLCLFLPPEKIPDGVLNAACDGLRNIAYQYECIDERELPFWFTPGKKESCPYGKYNEKSGQWEFEEALEARQKLGFLQDMLSQVGDFPPLWLEKGLPDDKTIEEAIKSNREAHDDLFRKFSTLCLSDWKRPEWKERLEYLNSRYSVYYQVRNVRQSYSDRFGKRRSLKHLRELIGEENLIKGTLPPPY